MRLLEHQAKELLGGYGVPLPQRALCRDLAEVAAAYARLVVRIPVGSGVVLKAQIPSGRRGRAGGVRFASSSAEAVRVAGELLDSQLLGYTVAEITLEERVAVAAELYLGVLTDTSSDWSSPLVMFSSEGGVEIEDLAARAPELILRTHADPAYGLHPYQCRDLVRRAGVPPEAQASLVDVIMAAYRAYSENDAELVELNPLAIATDGRVLALDAKVTIDNSARYRHPDLKEAGSDSAEARAAALGLSYVELDGNIGLISNGAGLTMATMDHIGVLGGRPANFMDTGERILRNGIDDGLSLLAAKPGVDVVLINVFGGGVQCDVIAGKIIEALAKRPQFSLPLVVSLNGRNAEIGRRILSESAPAGVYVLPTVDEAVAESVRLAGRDEAESTSGGES
jgi:succinyl-CoA synthetase beta subunit